MCECVLTVTLVSGGRQSADCQANSCRLPRVAARLAVMEADGVGSSASCQQQSVSGVVRCNRGGTSVHTL